jgi:hypothetical protein
VRSCGYALSARAELALLDGIGHLPHLTRGKFVGERLSSFINEEAAQASI